MVLALVLLPPVAGLLGGTGEAAMTADTREIATALGITFAKVAAFVALMLLVGRQVIPRVLHYVAHTGSRELFRLAVLSLALGVAYGATELFGVSFALGAFFAGMVLAESELSHRAAEESLPLRDAFAVLFFVSVGMLFDPTILVREPGPVIATLSIIVLCNPAAALLIVLAFRHPMATALTIAASLAQIGEFSFIVIIRPIGVVLDILFAGPHHLDRPFDLFGDLDCLGDAVHLQPPAKAAAQQVIVNYDLVTRQAGHLGSRGLGAADDLVADPHIATIGPYMDGAVHRLHCRVREKGRLVNCFESGCGAGHCLGEIALLARDDTGLVRGGLHLAQDVGTRHPRVRPFVPVDVEHGEPLQRRPHMLGDHRTRVVDAHDLTDALNRQRRAIVNASELAAKSRASRHRRDLHAGNFYIDAELSLAIHLAGCLDP